MRKPNLEDEENEKKQSEIRTYVVCLASDMGINDVLSIHTRFEQIHVFWGA